MRRSSWVVAALVAACGAAAWGQGGGAGGAAVQLQIDAGKKGAAVNPKMYGIFLEEIGHGVDGGLYAELLQNRAFEGAKAPEGFHYVPGNGQGAGGGRGRGRGNRTVDATGGRWVDQGGYATIFPWKPDESLPYWSVVQDGGGEGTATLDVTGGLNEATPRAAKLVVTKAGAGARVGIANEGFCAKPGSAAIGMKAGEQYELTFYAKAAPGFAGNVIASLEGKDGETWKPVTNVEKVGGITGEWKQYKATITASKTEGQARFVLAIDAPGTIWFDMVTLFPAKTFKGRANGLREDIAQKIADLKPGFVRFPGGCVVESSTVETAYNWKNTIGPVESRPEMWNAWDYRRTHGMGLFEYFQFIEDIGADPMYVAFAGQTCIYRNPEVVPMEQMGPIVQSYLDIMQYANGPADSPWGKQRAAAGHPSPFNLKMVEIGNENTDPNVRGQVAPVYSERYAMIFDALKKAHPEVQTIANIPMRGQTVEMIDDHHYSDTNWFFNNSKTFDGRSRQSPPLYLGEVAVTSQNAGPTRGNLLAALAEGAFLMGAERNGDVVKMVSYAPLLAHVDGRTDLPTAPPPYWHAMIYHDSLRSFGTVSYYLWQTFGRNVPTYNVETKLTEANAPTAITGNVGLGTWGTSAEFKDVKVEKDGKTLYASDFEKGTEGWKQEGGQWAVQDGAYRQSRSQNGFAYIGDESWSDYTVTLKARKLMGAEGFLVIFGHKGSDRYWWNLGAYGNTRHEIEMNQAVVGRAVQGQNYTPIEDGKWYDVKVEVKGMGIKCYLDGKLVHEVTAPTPQRYYAQAGRDEASGDLIVKVINPTDEALKAAVGVTGVEKLTGEGEATVITSAALTDNNDLDHPQNVVPRAEKVSGVTGNFEREFPARSLTVLRLKTR